MNNSILSPIRLRHETAEWLDEKIKPNTFVVATLKQSFVSTHNGYSQRLMGCRDIYHGVCRQALCRFSKAIYGESNWKRHRKRVPGFATLEGNGCGRQLSRIHTPLSLEFVRAIQPTGKKVRYHYNILLQRPEWIGPDEFEAEFRNCWSKNPWAMPDLFFEERSGDCVSYALKEGPEALDVMSISF